MTQEPQSDPKAAPVTGESSGDGPAEREPGGSAPLDADEHEPDVEPFAGDDDILSGHLDADG